MLYFPVSSSLGCHFSVLAVSCCLVYTCPKCDHVTIYVVESPSRLFRSSILHCVCFRRHALFCETTNRTWLKYWRQSTDTRTKDTPLLNFPRFFLSAFYIVFCFCHAVHVFLGCECGAGVPNMYTQRFVMRIARTGASNGDAVDANDDVDDKGANASTVKEPTEIMVKKKRRKKKPLGEQRSIGCTHKTGS